MAEAGMYVFMAALLVFCIRVYVYYHAFNPKKYFIVACLTLSIVPYAFISLFPMSKKKPDIPLKTISTINMLTYVFYALAVLSIISISAWGVPKE